MEGLRKTREFFTLRLELIYPVEFLKLMC